MESIDMTNRVCSVAVKELPGPTNGKHGLKFLAELEACMNTDCPRVLLDCSNVPQMDRSALHLMLCCLEAAMKRNGDVKLTGLSANAREVLSLTGVARLFECLDTNADGLRAFNRLPADGAWNHTAPVLVGAATAIAA
jgi:anti-anti-sigma factor